MWCLLLAAVAALALAETTSPAASSVSSAQQTSHASKSEVDVSECGSRHPEEDSALLQMGGLSGARTAALATDVAALVENVSDPEIAAILLEASAHLSRPSAEELQHFNLVKALRRRGYR